MNMNVGGDQPRTYNHSQTFNGNVNGNGNGMRGRSTTFQSRNGNVVNVINIGMPGTNSNG